MTKYRTQPRVGTRFLPSPIQAHPYMQCLHVWVLAVKHPIGDNHFKRQRFPLEIGEHHRRQLVAYGCEGIIAPSYAFAMV